MTNVLIVTYSKKQYSCIQNTVSYFQGLFGNSFKFEKMKKFLFAFFKWNKKDKWKIEFIYLIEEYIKTFSLDQWYPSKCLLSSNFRNSCVIMVSMKIEDTFVKVIFGWGILAAMFTSGQVNVNMLVDANR